MNMKLTKLESSLPYQLQMDLGRTNKQSIKFSSYIPLDAALGAIDVAFLSSEAQSRIALIFKEATNNIVQDTIKLAKEIWTKVKHVFSLILGLLHKAVKYVGKNPVILLYGLGEFHHH